MPSWCAGRSGTPPRSARSTCAIATACSGTASTASGNSLRPRTPPARSSSKPCAGSRASTTMARAFRSLALPHRPQRGRRSLQAAALRLRKPHLAAADDLVDPVPSPEEAAMTSETLGRLRTLLGALPPRERAVLELRLADLTTTEIAAVLGITEGSVWTAQSRGLAKVRDAIRSPHRVGAGQCLRIQWTTVRETNSIGISSRQCRSSARWRRSPCPPHPRRGSTARSRRRSAASRGRGRSRR